MYLRLLLIAAAWIGCKRDDGAQVSPPDLQIVSAGNEPRVPLHYRAAKGTTQQLAIAIDVEIGAGDMGGAMPTIVMTLAIKVEDVLPTGAMRLRTTIVETAAVDRDETRVPTAALSGPLELMKGIAFTTTMAPTGRLAGTRIELGDKQLTGAAKSQLAALTTSFDHLMMTLPDEPVGVGAVWRNSKPLEQNGMKLTAVNSVQLVAITGDKLELAVDTEVHGDDQTVKQGDLSVDIKDVIGTGGGKTTVDLGTLAVTSELTTEMRSTMQAAGESEITPMKMSIATRVTPK
ncbi:MAG TPA: DUF6263 family protein [Kofleriaceae bacterium]